MSGEKGICFLCHRKVRHKNKRDGEELSLKESNTQALTIGRPIVQILLFAIPLVLGTLFQQLYSFVDTVIVGRFIGVDALAAVGTTYSLNFLILGFAQGLCVGFGILLAQQFGARDRAELNHYFINGCYLSAGISLFLAVITCVGARPLLNAFIREFAVG